MGKIFTEHALKPGNLAIQFGVLAFVLLGFWSGVRNAQFNLETMGMTNGFGFLQSSTGWGYSFSLLERSINDSYMRTLTIGFLNTLFLGTLAIITTTFFGFVFGVLRSSPNPFLKTFAGVYVNIFRNIPLILQIVFWYAIFVKFPPPRQTEPMLGSIYFSNRGLQIPTLNVDAGAGVLGMVLALLVAVAILRWMRVSLGLRLIAGAAVALLILLATAIAFSPAEEGLLSIPALAGLRFQGGVLVSIEFVAMIVAITLYGSGYIAEVVRGGLSEVPKGLTEAGESLGLSRYRILTRIQIPVAMRSIIPPLGNQWIFMMKATTIGVAIGFSDLFMIVSTSLTQTGQTMELIFLLMAAFVAIHFTLAQVVNWMNARIQFKAN
ncbi:MAG: ABC transporter permease subunit [Pseudomonadota bacterium]